MERAKHKQQTVNLDRGLFLVRYAAAEDEIQPPKVKIRPEPPDNKDITLFLHPDHDEAVLWQPEPVFGGQGAVAGHACGPGRSFARRRLGRRNGQN